MCEQIRRSEDLLHPLICPMPIEADKTQGIPSQVACRFRSKAHGTLPQLTLPLYNKYRAITSLLKTISCYLLIFLPESPSNI